jgi:electron transfer flavoprotein beta subunit
MRIVACVKQIRHVYTRTGMTLASNFISEEDVVSIINPYDEIAVEEAIRVKERLGQGEVVLVTVGDLIAEECLRRCLAMGADRLVQINDSCFDHLDAWGVSLVLARAAKMLEPDVILCGKEALDDRGGQVGAYVAELLSLPYVSSVVKFELIPEEDKVRICRSIGRGNKEILECSLPGLFGVEKGLNDPRYPTVPNLLGAKDQEIEYWNRESLGMTMEDLQTMTEVLEICPPRPRPKTISPPSSNLDGFERTLLLLSGTHVEKSGQIVEEAPEELAQALLQFLKENRIVESGKTNSENND